MGLRAAFRIPPPDERVERWHISPLVDLSAYSLSWLWLLVPLLLLGPTEEDYLLVYLLLVVLNDLHRHFGLPYVYLDAQVRERYPARFWLFPALMAVAWLASPWLADSEWVVSEAGVCALAALTVVLIQVLRRDGGPEAVPSPELSIVLGASLGAAAGLHALSRWLELGVDGAWWWVGAALFLSTYFDWQRARRVQPGPPTGAEPAIASSGGRIFVASLMIIALMGITLLIDPYLSAGAGQGQGGVAVVSVLAFVGTFAALWNFWHVYMQKYGILRMYAAKAGGGSQGWLDKALLLCWLPLYFAWLGPMYREVAVEHFDDAAAVLPGFIDLLEQAMPVTVPLTAALVLLVYTLWLRAEWREHRLANAPRLWLVVGTTGLALCFLLFDPIKVYMAFAFSHALEYCVFIWAFHRKRYHAELAHQPPLGRLLSRPLAFYGGMILLFGVSFLLLKFWGRSIMPGAERPEVFGYRTAYWLGFWGIYQSMVHFYFDGFLWKMRLPSLRQSL